MRGLRAAGWLPRAAMAEGEPADGRWIISGLVTSAAARSERPLLSRLRLGAAGEWLALGLCGLVLAAALVWQAGLWARTRAIADVRHAAETAAALHVAALRSELEKYRSLPLVLAQDPDVRAALRHAAGEAALEPLNRKLEALSAGTRAAVIYILDARGLTIAASNWREPTSFVGQNYAFRPYFGSAVAAGSSEHFALGTMSQRPGYYLGRRIEDPLAILGVVVVKVEFDELEAEWRRGSGHAYVTDERGIVVITDRPEWRFDTLTRLDESVRQEIRESRQYGSAALDPLPVTAMRGGASDGIVRVEGPGRGTYLRVSQAVPTTAWDLHLLTPVDPAVSRAVAQTRLIATLSAALGLALAGGLLYARQRARRHVARQEQIRQQLERRVEERTSDLRHANLRLQGEVEERRRAEATLRQMADELVQANKLATLGQIAASVAHEVNQPLAAIRSYADNAAILLDRDRVPEARGNLGLISTLTDRIAQITQQLRSFSRKASGKVEPVSVRNAIAGSLMLVEHRARRQGVRLHQQLQDHDVRVSAEPVRLEQVLVNLLQNALDALVDRPDPEILIRMSVDPSRVTVTVSDNGPGIDPAIMPDLFSAFFTTRREGVGLGLAIARDIVQEFGGVLTAANRETGGASFIIELPRAD